MNKDDIVYLCHVLECMCRIAEDTPEGRARFLASHTLQDAVVRNLPVLAEEHSDFLAPARRLNQALSGAWGISFVSGAARSVTGQKPLQYQRVWSIWQGA